MDKMTLLQKIIKGTFLAASIVLLVAFPVQAVRGPQNVSGTIHNFSTSSGSPYVSDNEEGVCIFCHTPHGGVLNAPLWNRQLPNQAGNPFNHYTSSTLSSTIGPVNRPVSDESLVCMGCHDGSLAINMVINTSNSTGGQPTIWGGDTFMAYFVGIIGGFIGKSPQNDTDTTHRDLTDDHPISFSYQDALAEDLELHTVADAVAAGVRFFGSNSRLECSSCHDPHVDYDTTIGGDGDENYRPFLITPNNGSALCLACHAK